jgi:hypothetical protein
VYALPILKEGDEVEEVIDGAGKRAGIIVYKSEQREYLNPQEILEFKTI